MSQTFDSNGKAVLPPTAFENRSWPEDFSHENGNYNCFCRICGGGFIGHKRRTTCKICASESQNAKSATVTEEQIKHMAEQFLRYPLPEDFSPDGGVSFEAVGNKGTAHEYKREPVGTNLLCYTQALAMVRFMVDGLPPAEAE